MHRHFATVRSRITQTVAKWRCIKLCAFFSGPLYSFHRISTCTISEILSLACEWDA